VPCKEDKPFLSLFTLKKFVFIFLESLRIRSVFCAHPSPRADTSRCSSGSFGICRISCSRTFLKCPNP
jgi:hypothetical protein